MRKILALALLTLSFTAVACSTDPLVNLAGPFPTGSALNPNGTVPLAGSGNYVFNPTTGSYSRFSSDPKCVSVLGDLGQGCVGGSDGGAGGGGK